MSVTASAAYSSPAGSACGRLRSAGRFARRLLVALAWMVACFFCGDIAASAAEEPSPAPSSSPTPSEPASDSPSEVTLTASQWEPLLFAAGATVFLSAASFVASWRRS